MVAREVMNALPPFPLPCGQANESVHLDLTLSLATPSEPSPVHAVIPFARLASNPSLENSSRKRKRICRSANDSFDARSTFVRCRPDHRAEGLSAPNNFNDRVDGSAFVQYHPHQHAESLSYPKNFDDSFDGSISVQYRPHHHAESLSDLKNLSARLSVADLPHASMEGYGILQSAATLDGTATQYCPQLEKASSDPNNCLAKEAREQRKMNRKDMLAYERKKAQKRQKIDVDGSSILLHCVLKRWKKSLIKEEKDQEKNTPCRSFYATIFEEEEVEEEDKGGEKQEDKEEGEKEEEEIHEALDSLYGCLMEGYVSPTSFAPHSLTPTLPNPNSFASIVATTTPFSMHAPATMPTIVAATTASQISPSLNFPGTTCYVEDSTRHNQLNLGTRRSIGIRPAMDGKYPLASWKTNASMPMSPIMPQKETLIRANGTSPLDQSKLPTRPPTTIGPSYCLAPNATPVTYEGANMEQKYLLQTVCNGNNNGIDLHMCGKQSSSSTAWMDESDKHPNTHREQERENNEQTKKTMIWVSTRINGKKSIHGLMRIIGKMCVRIVCTCHRKGMSPSKFVKHGGGVDISHPEKHIIVNLMH